MNDNIYNFLVSHFSTSSYFNFLSHREHILYAIHIFVSILQVCQNKTRAHKHTQTIYIYLKKKSKKKNCIMNNHKQSNSINVINTTKKKQCNEKDARSWKYEWNDFECVWSQKRRERVNMWNEAKKKWEMFWTWTWILAKLDYRFFFKT